MGELLREDYPGKKDMQFSRRWIFLRDPMAQCQGGWLSAFIACVSETEVVCIYEVYDIALCHVERCVCLA